MSFWFFLITFFHVSEAVIRILALFYVPAKQKPVTAMAWLMVIFLWPYPGLILFMLFGSNVLPRKRLERHRELGRHLTDFRDSIMGSHKPAVVELAPHLAHVARLGETLGYMRALDGNSVQPFDQAPDMIRQLVADIDAAENHIHMLYYIFNPDEIGEQVICALERAHERGVVCKLMVDAMGSKTFIKQKKRHMRKKGIDVVEALPVGLLKSMSARFDLRNHRKLTVIDGRVGYTGSHNITDPSYGHADLVWHDISLRVTGPVVNQLQAVFVEDWFVETGILLEEERYFPYPEKQGDIIVQTVPSGPSCETENYQRLVVSALYAAKKNVVITTPYLIPDESLLQGLQVACLNGVKVQLIVPRASDQFLVGNAARAYYDQLLDMGVELYLYRDGLVHAKTMTVDDDLSFFGSSNFDIRSFALNFELNHIFYGMEELKALRASQMGYLEKSDRLTKEVWNKRGVRSTAIQGLTKMLSPLL